MNEKKELSLSELEVRRTNILRGINNPNQKGFLKVSATEFLKRRLHAIEKQIQEHPEHQVEEKTRTQCVL